MPVYSDFSLCRQEDGTLQVSMVPAVNVSGWPIQFSLSNRFGSDTPLVVKSCASGFNNVSGINVVDGAQGVLQIQIDSINTSGLEYGNYAARTERLSSGARTALTEGYLLLLP